MTVTHFWHFSCPKYELEKYALSIFDDSYTLWAFFRIAKTRPLSFLMLATQF